MPHNNRMPLMRTLGGPDNVMRTIVRTRALSAGLKGTAASYPPEVFLRNAPRSVFHQRHVGRMLRSP
jgi:hypothetical protein